MNIRNARVGGREKGPGIREWDGEPRGGEWGRIRGLKGGEMGPGEGIQAYWGLWGGIWGMDGGIRGLGGKVGAGRGETGIWKGDPGRGGGKLGSVEGECGVWRGNSGP